jgi:hypothetical protein
LNYTDLLAAGEPIMGRIRFQKRQKEMKRKEKQAMKAQKRAERKLAKTEISTEPEENFENIDLPQEPNTVTTS